MDCFCLGVKYIEVIVQGDQYVRFGAVWLFWPYSVRFHMWFHLPKFEIFYSLFVSLSPPMAQINHPKANTEKTGTLSLILDGMNGTVPFPIVVSPDGRGKRLEYFPHVNLHASNSMTSEGEVASTLSQR